MNKAKIRIVVELEVETPLDPSDKWVQSEMVKCVRDAVARDHMNGFNHELEDTIITPIGIGIEGECPLPPFLTNVFCT